MLRLGAADLIKKDPLASRFLQLMHLFAEQDFGRFLWGRVGVRICEWGPIRAVSEALIWI
jgi:hypothetical protein